MVPQRRRFGTFAGLKVPARRTERLDAPMRGPSFEFVASIQRVRGEDNGVSPRRGWSFARARISKGDDGRRRVFSVGRLVLPGEPEGPTSRRSPSGIGALFADPQNSTSSSPLLGPP